MTVFVIQVSGGETTHKETGAKYWWQEPIEKNVYINYDWDKKQVMTDAWKNIKEGDKVIVYCTSNVEPYPSQLSHVFSVWKVELSSEKAKLYLKDKKELRQPMSRDEILEKVESRELSEGMGRCGSQGFNIWQVAESDTDVVQRWSESREIEEGTEISREIDLQKHLMKHPEKIEAGLRVVDPEKLLPEGAGIPDIVCKDSGDNYVVVELKAGQAGYDALGQIVSYRGALVKKTGAKVRGIIVASDFDPKIRFGTDITDSQGVKLVELKKYSVNFDLKNA